MSSTFRLVPAKERDHSSEADVIGVLLAEQPGWVGPFVIFLDGLNFKSVPSMTVGSMVFEAATHRSPDARRVIAALDEAYTLVRDGYDTAHLRGELLERYVFHSLAKGFPLRLGACGVECDGTLISDYRLDAATNSECPAVAVEAKTSEKALVGRRGPDRDKHTAKSEWLIALFAATDGNVLPVFVTWAPEVRFRKALASLVGEDVAKSTYIYGHEQVAQLPGRISALAKRLGVGATA